MFNIKFFYNVDRDTYIFEKLTLDKLVYICLFNFIKKSPLNEFNINNFVHFVIFI